MSDDSSSAPAGWYPDPADDARLRRWDGAGWTQDVIIAPAESPSAFAPPTPQQQQPPSAPFVHSPPPAAPAAAATPPVAPQPSAPPPVQQPPVQQPPVQQPPVQQPPVQQAPAAASGPSAPPRSSGSDAQPNSGPVSLPEWATLPGLTLPPDLSMIPGMGSDSVLSAPTFADPEPAERSRILPRPDWSQAPTLEPPVFTSPTDAQQPDAPTQPTSPPRPPTADAQRPTAPDFPPPPPPRRGPAPAQNYAPPPGGAQYDAPPPPGASPAPGASIALPASSLVAPQMPALAWASGPVIDRNSTAPVDFDQLPRTSAGEEPGASGSILTLWAWQIAILPLLQFVIVYLVFVQLHVAFSPGIQWGILAAPAAFSLLFATGDRRRLAALGVDRIPSPLLALVPPVYLLVRSFDVGRSSAGALVAWILLQAAAVAGAVYLMPHILSQAIAAS